MMKDTPKFLNVNGEKIFMTQKIHRDWHPTYRKNFYILKSMIRYPDLKNHQCTRTYNFQKKYMN